MGFEGVVYKIRIPSSDMKRGGFRVIYYVITSAEVIDLLTIYAKARTEDIDRSEIQRLLDELDIH